MNKDEILDYYKKAAPFIVSFSQNREFVPVYWKNGEKGFGKRPNYIEYEQDLLYFVKRGATSFHVSEERWKDIDKLAEAKREKELNELRIGWDLVIDIDSPDFSVSKLIAKEILKFLKSKNIISFTKYSGNKGFHIIIPWEEFPKKIEWKDKELDLVKEFPRIPRLLIFYIMQKVRKSIENKLNEEVLKAFGFSKETLLNQIEIDMVLVSSRHLFRSVYSLNEKQWLASIPVENISKFSPEDALPEFVQFIEWDFSKLKENSNLEKLIKAALLFDEEKRNERWEKLKEELSKIDELKPRRGRKKKNHPPCIRNILKGLKDGRKRAVFILINYFRRLNYSWEEIRKILYEWNEKNEEPLKERYIEYQIEWHKRKEEEGIRYLPPNCDRLEYYKDMGVCEREKDPRCQKIKNPLNY